MFNLALALSFMMHVHGAACGNDSEACAAVDEASQIEFLQTSHSINALEVAHAKGDRFETAFCASGLSTSCSNSYCTVTCAGNVLYQDMYCPMGISNSCSNGDCTITCKGGIVDAPTSSGVCDRYQCSGGIQTSCSNGLCDLSCGGDEFCSDLYCPDGISTSCSNGDCIIDCRGGTGCQGPSCAVFADPHVVGFDSFHGHHLPSHMSLIGQSGCENRPINVNAYDTGDFWLVRNNQVKIQGRFVLSGDFKPDKAAVGSVAVGGPFLDGKKLLVGPQGSIMMGGSPLEQGSLSLNLTSGSVHISSFKGPRLYGKPTNIVDAKLPLGVYLHFVQFPNHVDTRISLPHGLKVDGECGNDNGVAEDDTEEAVDKRMGGLKVDAADKLF